LTFLTTGIPIAGAACSGACYVLDLDAFARLVRNLDACDHLVAVDLLTLAGVPLVRVAPLILTE